MVTSLYSIIIWYSASTASAVGLQVQSKCPKASLLKYFANFTASLDLNSPKLIRVYSHLPNENVVIDQMIQLISPPSPKNILVTPLAEERIFVFGIENELKLLVLDADTADTGFLEFRWQFQISSKSPKLFLLQLYIIRIQKNSV